MRTLYLIRHAHPDFPLGAHMCLGRTDTPLGPLGRMQAFLLGEGFRSIPLNAVFTSPLLRCRETAAPLSRASIPVPDLAEQDMGVWDGLDFDQIQKGWPELYAKRQTDPLLVPPRAETLAQVRLRVLPALQSCLGQSEGDIAVVAHASVIQAILSQLLDIPLAESRKLRPDYAGYALLEEEDGQLNVRKKNLRARPALTPGLAEALLTAAAPGERIVAHSRAVKAEALRIAEALPLNLDRELLASAALLHDVARAEQQHAALGGRWLRELGYPEAAQLVEQHHDWAGEAPDEAAILYLADKLCREDQRVTLEERFAESREKCKTAEALAAHERRYAQARHIQELCNQLCGYSLIS